MSARGHDQQPSHRGTEPPIPAALPCRRRAEPLSEVDGVPCQRWMESPIRDGWSPPPEMDGVPHQRRMEPPVRGGRSTTSLRPCPGHGLLCCSARSPGCALDGRPAPGWTDPDWARR